MNSKLAFAILGIVIAIIVIIIAIKPQNKTSDILEPVVPVTTTTIQTTPAKTPTPAAAVTGEIVTPATPTAPTFPTTGFEPAQ